MPEIKINKPIEREAIVRAITDKNKEDRTAEFVISSEAVDTWGTVFRMDGWDLSRYQRNPVVLYAHRAHSDNPDTIIGISEVFREGNQLIGRITFEPEDINPLAEKVYRKVMNGTLRMASIGANPLDAHWGDDKKGEVRDVLYFDRQELLEWSIVPIGSNPDALKRSADLISEIKKEIPKQAPPAPDETIKRSVRERQLQINKNRSTK